MLDILATTPPLPLSSIYPHGQLVYHHSMKWHVISYLVATVGGVLFLLILGLNAFVGLAYGASVISTGVFLAIGIFPILLSLCGLAFTVWKDSRRIWFQYGLATLGSLAGGGSLYLIVTDPGDALLYFVLFIASTLFLVPHILISRHAPKQSSQVLTHDRED